MDQCLLRFTHVYNFLFFLFFLYFWALDFQPSFPFSLEEVSENLTTYWTKRQLVNWKHTLQIPLNAGVLMVNSFSFLIHLKMILFLLVTNPRLAVSIWLALMLFRSHLSVYCYSREGELLWLHWRSFWFYPISLWSVWDLFGFLSWKTDIFHEFWKILG